MKREIGKNRKYSFNSNRLGVLACLLSASQVQALDLNYESLSSLEEPIAFQYNDITFSLTGLVDAAVDRVDSDNDFSLLGNFQLSAETQLANSWTLGAAYFGEYSGSEDDKYDDNAAIYLGGVLGTVSVGDVTGVVREQTRRIRGVGNSELSFDDNLGQLSDTGLTYIGRFGPIRTLATVDEDGGFEIGNTYQRPIGNKDYRFSLRYRNSQFTPENTDVTFDSQAVGLVGELTYGSTVINAGLGYETLDYNAIDADRTYVSAGIVRKIGVLSLSAEALFSDIEGQNMRSYAIGFGYDIARGLSLNLGINHSDAIIAIDDIELLTDDRTQGILSLRYSF